MNKRNKIQIKNLISKLNRNEYGTDDLEVLFTSMRGYVSKNTFVRELGDFINHPEGKTSGALHDAMSYMFYRMWFFRTYQFKDAPPLTVDGEYPNYFKNLLLLTLRRKPILDKIKIDLNLSRDQAKNIINRLLPAKTKGKFDREHCTERNLRLVNQCLGLLAPGSEIDAAVIVEDFLRSIRLMSGDISTSIEEDKFDKNKFILHVFEILNAKEFFIYKDFIGYCELRFDKLEIHQSHLDSLRENEVDIRKKWSTFGNVQLGGLVMVPNGDSELKIAFPLISSDIDSMEYIDGTLLVKELDYANKEVIKLEVPEVFAFINNKIVNAEDC